MDGNTTAGTVALKSATWIQILVDLYCTVVLKSCCGGTFQRLMRHFFISFKKQKTLLVIEGEGRWGMQVSFAYHADAVLVL